MWAYDDEHRDQLSFFDRSIDELLRVPGVASVGLTTDLPLADDHSVLSRTRVVRLEIDGRDTNAPGDEPSATLAGIDAGYLDAMGIGLRAGRNFSTRDHTRAPPVVMVNEAFVRRHFPQNDAVGRRITPRWRAGHSREIVGIIADVRRDGFESQAEPEIYVPLSQEPSNGLTFVIRTDVRAGTLTQPVQEALWAADRSQATWAIRPMLALASDWTRQRRFTTTILTTFAGLALFLATIGVYGLMSFVVEQQANEWGIRRAVGGQTGDILRMVLRRGIGLTLAGVCGGVAGALVLTRALDGMLYQIDRLDPLTFVSQSILVGLVALLATLLPALRATRIDPMEVLRRE